MMDKFRREKLKDTSKVVSRYIQYYPGSATTMTFLTQATDWLSKHTPVTGQKWKQYIHDSRSTSAFLPPTDGAEYIGCKGSEEKYRGYPCGLWTLYHVLTAEAYRKSLIDPESFDAQQAVHGMGNYIINFFSCLTCAKNFKKEIAEIDKDMQSSKDAIIYLWRVHNRVNKRLSNDAGEDPEFPKMEFPTPRQCPRCRTQKDAKSFYSFESKFNEKEVLAFLLSFYLPKHLVPDAHPLKYDPEIEADEAKNEKTQRKQDFEDNRNAKERKRSLMNEKIQKIYNEKLHDAERLGKVQSYKEVEYKTRLRVSHRSGDGITNTDLGLCVFFYVICVALLVLVYLKITNRRGAPWSRTMDVC